MDKLEITVLRQRAIAQRKELAVFSRAYQDAAANAKALSECFDAALARLRLIELELARAEDRYHVVGEEETRRIWKSRTHRAAKVREKQLTRLVEGLSQEELLALIVRLSEEAGLNEGPDEAPAEESSDDTNFPLDPADAGEYTGDPNDDAGADPERGDGEEAPLAQVITYPTQQKEGAQE